jgi:protein required for attachment to host cells
LSNRFTELQENVMQTTWIVAADNTRARIFEMRGAQGHLNEIEDFVNPAAEAKTGELVSDARGRFGGGGQSAAHTGEPDVTPRQHEAEQFSKQVGAYLDSACSQHRYDKLCLIAFPKFLGMLRQNLSKEAQQRVKEEVSKDISHLDAHAIEDYVKNRLH